MKFLKKFNEDLIGFEDEKIDFSVYHNITEEEISDLCLEMTDAGFTLDINKYFMSNGRRTSEPITNECYPIYDITLDRSEEKLDDIEGNRFNGSFYYQDMDTLSSFKSIVNKMIKLLPTYKVYYTVSNTRYYIRLILPKINLNKIGFDFYDFKEKLFKLCEEIKNESPRRRGNRNLILDDDEIHEIQFSGSGGGNNLSIKFMTDGDNYKENVLINKFKEVDELDNKDLYIPIKKKISDFLRPYMKFINLEIGYEENTSVTHPMKNGFMKKTIKRYKRYKLWYNISKKSTS